MIDIRLAHGLAVSEAKAWLLFEQVSTLHLTVSADEGVSSLRSP